MLERYKNTPYYFTSTDYLREEVNINHEGDRYPTVTFDNLYLLTDNTVGLRRIFEYEAKYPDQGVKDFTSSSYTVIWPDGKKDEMGPLSIPKCGWIGDKLCSKCCLKCL